jgi:signal transduction histidine kinase
MVFGDSSHPSRRLIALLLSVTLVPLGVLLWVGWRVLEQDRQLEQQQRRTRVERAADLVVGSLQRAIGLSEQRLAAGATDWPAGAVSLTFVSGRLSVAPRGRLAYLPVVTADRVIPSEAFLEPEIQEFRNGDRQAAVEAYHRLSRSRDPAVRAGALLRLGRNLAASGKTDAALSTYEQALDVDDAFEVETPVALAARYARCRLFEGAGRERELRAEALRLERDLASGRWALTAPTYFVYIADAERWAGVRSPHRAEAEAFAEASSRLWDGRDGRSGQGRFFLTAGGVPLTVLSLPSPEGPRFLLASSDFVRKEWMTAAQDVAREQHVALAFRGPDERPLFESTGPRPSQAPAYVATRTRADAELPWAVEVTSLAGRDEGFVERRRWLLAGFIVLVGMALGASYLIGRAIAREIAVARLQSEFVAAVSHEFRTPLTTLRQFTDMLRDQPHLDQERRKVCYDAQARATDRLTRLVESILDFRRMEAGARPYRLEQADSTALVQEVIDDFRAQPQAAGRSIVFERKGSRPVDVDVEALSRAIWNLLDNAIKYSPDGGPVEVATSGRDGHICISVTDHGLGIPAHERRHLFSRFQRGEQARKRGIQGTGIGLAMVDQIARAHRGRVDVASEPGTGSTFTIVLPAKDT